MKRLLPYLIGTSFVAAGWLLVGSLYRVPVGPSAPSGERIPFDSASIRRNLDSSERAVGIDPYGALGWSMLASADLAKCRETDDGIAAQRAEQAARKSLSLRKLGNVGALNKLVSSLLAQHRFLDALRECESAELAGIYSDDTILLKADTLIEVGRYEDAQKLCSAHPRAFANASGWAVQSRLLDIFGKPNQAVALLQRAVDQMEANSGASSDTVAWFHIRLAQEQLRCGMHRQAEEEFRTALRLYPRNYKAMSGLARIAYQRGQWKEAISWAEMSNSIAGMADIAALAGDCYRQLGDLRKARECYEQVALMVGRPSGMNDGMHEVAPTAGTHGHRLDRQYALFCADHGLDLGGAYASAIRDLSGRRDIYAFDTLAWVCLKMGNLAEASTASQRASQFGTQDPMLLYHAGVIAAANGMKDRGRELLGRALEIDPEFDPKEAAEARRLLSELRISVASRDSKRG